MNVFGLTFVSRQGLVPVAGVDGHQTHMHFGSLGLWAGPIFALLRKFSRVQLRRSRRYVFPTLVHLLFYVSVQWHSMILWCFHRCLHNGDFALIFEWHLFANQSETFQSSLYTFAFQLPDDD